MCFNWLPSKVVNKVGHLTEAQRYKISALLGANHSQTFIAQQLGRDKSVISREIKRNSDKRSGNYNPELAQRKCNNRKRTKPKAKTFTSEVKKRMLGYLLQDLSPEQIKGKCTADGVAMVSHERIYQHIWLDKKQGGQLYVHLRTTGKRYRKRGAKKDRRGIIKGRVGIENRPQSVELKESFGDLEIDTIIGRNHQQAIVTINDRATGYLWMKKVPFRTAALVQKATVELLLPVKELLNTITSDNGKEFANHQIISKKLDLGFYFARPYHSWERGANENLNGLIRQYIPKKTDFSTISPQFIRKIQDKLNDRPRKRYDYLSPKEMFNQKVAFAT